MREIRRVRFLLDLIAIVFFILPVIGCQQPSSGDSGYSYNSTGIGANASVVSRWVNSTEGNGYEVITLYDDGTYTYEKYENDELTGGQQGTYSSDNDETKLTVTKEWLEGKWSDASGFGFYIKINGNTIEVIIWKTKEDGTEDKSSESSSFTLDTESGGGSSSGSGGSDIETGNSGSTSGGNSESSSYFTVAEAAEYITSLTEKGTYYVKVIDDTETSCSALKTALISVNDKDIYIELDLSETIVSVEEQNVFGCSYDYSHNKVSYSLLSIIFPNNCTSIGQWSFTGCSNLESITIPPSVIFIGKWAFGDCSLLTSAVFEDPNGWIVSTAKGYVNIGESVLISPSTAAQYLTKTYYSTDWNKE